MRQQGSRIGRGRRYLELRRSLDAFGCLDGSGMCEPANDEKKNDAENRNADDEREKRIGAAPSRGGSYAGDFRHFRLEARG